MKFINWFSTHFWSIMFYGSTFIYFGGKLGLFTIDTIGLNFHFLIAFISLATGEILKTIKDPNKCLIS